MSNTISANSHEISQELTTLDKRRPLIYSILLVFQTLHLISNTILIPGSREVGTSLSYNNAAVIDLVIILLLNVTIMNFLYYFIKRKIFFWGLTLLLAISIILNFINNILDLHDYHFATFRMVYGLVTLIDLGLISLTFFVAVRDIFGKNLKIGSALLGAANIYLLIGSGFAFIYVFLNILMPGSMVPIAELGMVYNTCVIQSTYVLGGMDLPSNNFLPAIKNLMMFESIFAHLFAVFIVGRLLAK